LKLVTCLYSPHNVADLVLANLNPLDTISYSKCSGEARHQVTSFNKRAFQITKLLHCFMTPAESEAFRRLQQSTSTVISGSGALYFMDRRDFKDFQSDLDLSVLQKRCEHVVTFFLKCKYSFQPRPSQPKAAFEALTEAVRRDGRWSELPMTEDDVGYPESVITDVLTFTRGGRKVQVVVCRDSVLEVLLNFHSCEYRSLCHHIQF
jgi:hypothetical protein